MSELFNGVHNVKMNIELNLKLGKYKTIVSIKVGEKHIDPVYCASMTQLFGSLTWIGLIFEKEMNQCKQVHMRSVALESKVQELEGMEEWHDKARLLPKFILEFGS